MRRRGHARLRAVDDTVRALVAGGTVARIYAAYGVEHRVPQSVATR